MKAVLLAAGKGTRLYPHTVNRPKPLLMVGGRPLLEWMLMRVKEAGVTEILIVTNYLEEHIWDYFDDGRKYGVNITYKHQEEMRGTANAFQVGEEWVGDDQFLGLYGDHYLSHGTLKRLVRDHRGNESTVSALHIEDPSQYGVLDLEGDVVKKVVEKPPKGTEPSNYANVGIYIFQPDVFKYIKKTPESPRGEYEITDTMQLMINDGYILRKHEIQNEDWLDIGLPWMLLEANERALSNLEHRIEGTVEEGARLYGPIWLMKDARIRSGAYIEGPVVIGKGSDVGPNCFIRSATCLGKNVRIGNACEVKNSIIMDDTHAAHLSYIGDSVIGTNCNLGAGTITANLRFDKSEIEVNVKDERLYSGRHKLGVMMGDNVQTGISVNIHPGVIIGNDSWLGPGVTVQHDVSEGVIQFFRSRLEERVR
jgi:bifunctional UDP-N-acetylglucosamine pyrophosphorylase/glucosamine-1-phosphate N-acetyltransferase